jgi:hypothetical protein
MGTPYPVSVDYPAADVVALAEIDRMNAMNRYYFALLIAGLLAFTAGVLAGLEIALLVRP